MRTTEVNKSLDKKLKILGFEIPDLLFVFLFIGVMNFVVGESEDKIIWVWGPAALLAWFVRFSKRNKPDNFLIHWIRNRLLPSGFRAFPKAKQQNFPYKDKK